MTTLELDVIVRPCLRLALPPEHRSSFIEQLLPLAKENVSMIVVMGALRPKRS